MTKTFTEVNKVQNQTDVNKYMVKLLLKKQWNNKQKILDGFFLGKSRNMGFGRTT